MWHTLSAIQASLLHPHPLAVADTLRCKLAKASLRGEGQGEGRDLHSCPRASHPVPLPYGAAMALVFTQAMPKAAKLFRAASSEPAISMARQASSKITALKPLFRASSAV